MPKAVAAMTVTDPSEEYREGSGAGWTVRVLAALLC
jgi:hypothetical protein